MKRVGILVVLAAGVASLACRRSPQADLVVHHGKIVTVDPGFRIAEAMAIRGDRILATGSDSEMLALAAPDARRIDLAGRTVLPGLTDSHLHAVGAAMYEFDHPVPDMETIADVLGYIQARAAAVPKGEWIHLSQVFITRLKEQRYPTRQELDRVAPAHPVVFSTGPDASLNSLALKRSGIDRNFQPGDGQCRVERDPASGEPTGILRNCSHYIKDKSEEKQPQPEDYLRRMRMLLADYNSVGLTSIVDGDTSDEEVEIYRQLKARGQLTCRTFLVLHVNANDPFEKIEARIRQAAVNPLHKYDNLLWLRGIKSYLDGGMLTGSAYMLEPWGVSKVYSITDPAYRGMRYIDAERLYRLARLALENGFQFTVHAVGDGAVSAIVEAYERVNQDFPVHDKRPSITHANFMTAEAIRKMKELGIVANLQPDWLYLDGATLRKQFGDARLAYFQPYKTLFEQGVVVGGGSDHMQKIGSLRSINQYNPFLGMWVTLTRQPRWTDQPLHPEQRITREQAIRLYTINNAYLTFEEKEKGSLEPGKLADFIVLDRDILTCPEDGVKDTQVDQTYLGGKLVYTRKTVAQARMSFTTLP
ncbi:MAG TPA: amidohydrolase [Bryobacteraceae bacterium]|nr:amidohydrolase [Bryobacteraceae bacterium]